jgi:hypothetical protein
MQIIFSKKKKIICMNNLYTYTSSLANISPRELRTTAATFRMLFNNIKNVKSTIELKMICKEIPTNNF